MKRELLAGVGMLLAASSMSYAQTTPSVPSHSDAKAVPAAGAMTPDTQATGTSVRQQLSANLKTAGYTDVKIMPEAFIVEAKNKAGDPVTMFLKLLIR